MPNIREAMPMLTWAIDMAAPFALGTSFQYTIRLNAQTGNPNDAVVCFGDFSSRSANKLITGMAVVIYNEASKCWLPLSVAFRYSGISYDVQFSCVLKVGRVMVITMTLDDE